MVDAGAAIVVTAGPAAGRRVAVAGEIVIGREVGDLAIDDAELSRRHAVVRLAGTKLEIEDLGSMNGTWVNGQRISGAVALAPGDVARLGKTTIEVEGGRPTTPPPPLEPFTTTPASRRSPASRRLPATILAIAAIVATAVALLLYFALR